MGATTSERTARTRDATRAPVPRPDRAFYAGDKAFGRFGMRIFTPQLMQAPHSHGHVEFNWLTAGSMDYAFANGPVTIGANRLVAFWAGINHQAIGLGDTSGARQINIYLPMDSFLEMSQLGSLTETLMGGGVIQLTPACAGLDMLERWYADYRSGDARRTDLVRGEIGSMLRRAAITGWDTLLPAWTEKSGPRSQSALPVRHVVRMVRYIVENIAEPLDVDAVAASAGLHPNYAATMFKRVMRISIQKFVVRLRLIRARALLFDGNTSVSNVAFQAGFGSQTQFHEHFRRAYGMTPNQLRRDL